MSINGFPKGIKTFTNRNYSYINSVIQSLGSLNCINILINQENLQLLGNNPRFTLTKELFQILFNRNFLGKEACSDDLYNIFYNTYDKNKSSIKTINVLKPDPFHFLFFLLHFIHKENNITNDPNHNPNFLSNQNIIVRKNDDYMLDLFMDYYKKNLNSFISNNFFNIDRIIYNCPKCGEYYLYSMNNILRINVESVLNYRDTLFPNRKGTNINLEDIFDFYIYKTKTICKFCSNQIEKKREMFSPANILIISLERNIHNFKNDIDFDIHININKYISKKIFNNSETNINMNYMLKSCISYCSQIGKYFADCNINGIWTRFNDTKVKKLEGIKLLLEYETQILIYEQIDNTNNQSNPQNYNIQSNNLNNSNDGIGIGPLSPQFNKNNNDNQFNDNSKFFMNNNQFNLNNINNMNNRYNQGINNNILQGYSNGNPINRQNINNQ